LRRCGCALELVVLVAAQALERTVDDDGVRFALPFVVDKWRESGGGPRSRSRAWSSRRWGRPRGRGWAWRSRGTRRRGGWAVQRTGGSVERGAGDRGRLLGVLVLGDFRRERFFVPLLERVVPVEVLSRG